MRINIEEAKASLTEKPLLSTSAERFKIMNEIKALYKDLSQPEQFSKQLSLLLVLFNRNVANDY